MARRKSAPSLTSAVRDDPVEFTQALCIDSAGRPAQPHPAQIEIMRGMGHHTTIACGRQFGKSILLGWYISWFLATHPHREVLVVAPTLDQAKIIFRMVHKQFTHGALSTMVDGKVRYSPFPEISLINGSTCYARGANSPQYIRGHSPHLVIIDEAAFIKDGTLRELEPLMTVTGNWEVFEHSGIIMISTPFGAGEFQDFYNMSTDDPGAYYRRHHYTSLDNPYADMKFLNSVKNRWGEESLVWRTEYLAQFVDGEMAVFPWEDIKWAYENYPYLDKENGAQLFPVGFQQDHKYVSGVDLANTSDYFVQTVLDTTNSALCVLVKMNRLQHKGYDHYKNLVRQEWREYNHPDTLIDATTLAEMFVEDLRDISAEGYKFTGTTAKYDAIQALVKMLSEHRLAIPYDQTIIDELKYFVYDFTPTKKLKMEAKRGHDDIVLSLSLASLLAARPHNTGFFMPVDFEQTTPKPKPVHKGYYDPFKEAFEEGWED